MSEQHSEILAGVELAEAEAPALAMVVVSDGYGVSNAFRSLGARVVGGGQTNNPSVQDIADAVRSVGADTVLVLPNNKNIVMAAERVDELVPERDVRVLPTRTLGQGLAAAVMFREDADPDALMEEMLEAAQASRTLEVTTASRDATIEGVEVAEGQFIGLVDGKLVASGATPEEVLLDLVARQEDEHEIGTLFHASSIEVDTARATADRLMEAHEDLEVEVHAGAPDLYPYLMVLE
jgi:dihydroxyacetone kinase-like predicted kinase